MLPLLLLLALTGCGPSTPVDVADYTIDLLPMTAINQTPFSSLDSLELIVTPTTGAASTYDLDPITSGSTPEIGSLPALDGATLSIQGFSGDKLVAYGHSAPVTASTGQIDVPILFTSLDRFAWLSNLSAPSYGGAAAPDGTGRILLFGGNPAGPGKGHADETLSTVSAIDLATPPDGLALTQVGDMPALSDTITGRMLHTATLLTAASPLQGQILIAGGGSNGTNYDDVTDSAFLWDPSTDQVGATYTMNTARELHTAVEDQLGHVLIIGGFGQITGNYYAVNQSIESFDPATGAFTTLSGTKGPMLASAAASLGSGGVLVCGGFDLLRDGNNEASDVCDLVSTAGDVSAATALTEPVAYASMTPLGEGKVLLTGGLAPGPAEFNQIASIEATTAAYVYENSTWTQVGDMGVARAGHGSALLPDGRVLVFGGLSHTAQGIYPDASDALACAEIYDPSTQSFSPVEGPLGACSATDTQGPIDVPAAYPGFAEDPDFGVAVFGGLGPPSSSTGVAAVNSASLFVGCPDGSDC